MFEHLKYFSVLFSAISGPWFYLSTICLRSMVHCGSTIESLLCTKQNVYCLGGRQLLNFSYVLKGGNQFDHFLLINW